jgi:enamine deaminase RidA (YjgF/YER057c/UK114 family)
LHLIKLKKIINILVHSKRIAYIILLDKNQMNMRKKQITNFEVLNEASSYEKPSGFSRGIRVETNGVVFLFISGTASIDNKGKSIHIGNFSKQTNRTYYNLKKLLESEGATWRNVVKTTVYIKDINKHYDEFNKLRINFFKEEDVLPYPASVGVQATLCRDELLVEMDAIAII